MRKVVFAINCSADGYCGHTDMNPDDELMGYFTELLHNASHILFGRTTYQLMVPYWPDVARNPAESPADVAFARAFVAVEKIVFSTTMDRVEENHTRLVRANLAEEVRALKEQSGRDISVGSLSLASQLSERGLIDEYRFVVHPVLVGKGPRLFDTAKLKDRLLLELNESKTFRSGVVALHYRKHA